MAEKHQNVFVTGATGAIGLAIARNIANNPDYRVILIVRNVQKARKAVDEIRNETGNDKVDYMLADLSESDSIVKLYENWSEPLHVLINNAATTPRRRTESRAGIEMQFATNVLAYFHMMQTFRESLKKAAPSRVVNVASYWAGRLDLSDLEFKKRAYDNNTAYMQSKQADRMLSKAFAEKLKPYQISVNACHPGDVNSQLSNKLGFGGHESPDQGAATPVWLATTEAGIKNSGKYFENKREQQDQFVRDMKSVERLYEICESYL